MNILGINCATEHICVALLKGEVLTERSWNGQTIKAEHLISFIQEVLQAAQSSLAEVEAVALAIGPGAFTGLRLSSVTAKTICLAKHIPLIAISTLEALQAQYAPDKKIRIVLDACRGDVSTALFDHGTRLEPDHPVPRATIDDLKSRWESQCTTSARSAKVAEFTDEILDNPIPDAATLCRIARESQPAFDQLQILKIVPLYSHESRINKTNKPELQHLKIGNTVC